MTQRTLGAAAEIHPNTIARLERGRLTDVPGKYVARLARALGTSADYLLGLSEQEEITYAALPPPQDRRHAATVG
jgi:transcriptional regulator with XRE-family HTH domain